MINVPNQEKTPRRTIRVDDALWQAAQAKADADETVGSVSDVVRQALEQYVSGEPV